MKRFNQPDPKEWPNMCTRPMLERQELEATVRAIFAEVRQKGDQALKMYTARFDSVKLESVLVRKAEIEQAASSIEPQLANAIDLAARNIRLFHSSQRPSVQRELVEIQSGVECWREARAIERVGLYVPGGTAPLISTVLMLGIPAQLAGCKKVVMATPAQSNGQLNAGLCYAAQAVGIDQYVQVGGAQAIAGLTFGTQSIPQVDKIFGPGNQYVTAAKAYAQQFGVAVDMPAGPSELMVIADETARPDFVAADLLSQAEHGFDSQVVLVATKESIADAVEREIMQQIKLLPRRNIASVVLKESLSVVVSSLDQAIAFANVYAPEHLILSIRRPLDYSAHVVNVGSVFLGNYSPESAGDYASGTNHTLPTNGWARSYGGVSLDSFVKKVSFQSLTKDGLADISPAIVTLARAEGLEAHARAVLIRSAMNSERNYV